MRYLLFGTGDYYERCKKWFDRREVLALLDNAQHKIHTLIDGIEVLPPAEGIRLAYDAVVILSFHIKEMKQQLIGLGVSEERIYHFYDLHRLLAGRAVKRPLRYFLDAGDIAAADDLSGYKILLLSHDMTFGGPAIALFHAAEVLKKHGYKVVYCSMIDGPLREKLVQSDIPVIIDENLQIATMKETGWVDSFSLILCNTLNFHVFLSERDTRIPIIWWLHDARFFYDGVDRNVIGKISLDNLRGVSVGPVPEKAVREFLPGLKCGRLLYGVTDSAEGERPGDSAEEDRRCGLGAHGKVRFITIGFLEKWKGQDILLDAISGLPVSVRESCEFCIVGHDRTMYGEEIRRGSAGMEEIIFTGSVDRERIHALLESSDILVCPSRQDSMPTVAAEAMMHAVPCIISDAAGTAAYIHDGEDGFVFPSEDAEILMEKLIWCVTNREKLAVIGKNARRLYEQYFSMAAFEEDFLRIINEMLENKGQ